MKLKITGAADTQKLLRIIGEDMKKKGIRRAVRAGANVIKDAIVERAPVQAIKGPGSNALDPGELKDDIHVHMKTEEGEPVAIIGPGPDTAYVARWMEYGHRMVRNTDLAVGTTGKGRGRLGKGGSVVGWVPPYPFIRPGFEASVGEAIKTCAEETGKQLKEAVK